MKQVIKKYFEEITKSNDRYIKSFFKKSDREIYKNAFISDEDAMDELDHARMELTKAVVRRVKELENE